MKTLNNLERFVRLTNEQKNELYAIIHKCRNEFIKDPSENVKIALEFNKDIVTKYLEKNQISNLITFLREAVYDEYLVNEKIFVKQVMIELNEKIEIANRQINVVVDSITKLPASGRDKLKYSIETIFGDYTSAIFPYIYEISLSNTQSRRSRAGKTFEFIIYSLYEQLEYNYDSQAKIGRKIFKEQNLGKIVDSILPSVDAFNQLRNKTIVGSMKTTLRERWQEVVEEVSRSNLPNIYLLTIDDSISESKVKQMGEHNIILVVLESVKNHSKLIKYRNVISFETYFLSEIPNALSYWKET